MNLQNETPIQDLERRRESGTDSPDGAKLNVAPSVLSDDHLVDENLRPRIAIYLIEREAIELRRQRWIDSYSSDTSASARYSASALRAPLAKYDRPQPARTRTASPSRISKVSSWLKSLFRGE